MLLSEYVFVPRVDSEEARSELESDVHGLFGDFAKNGQVWGEQAWGWVDGSLRVMCMLPRPDALSPAHHSDWAAKTLERVASLCARAPIWRVLDDGVQERQPPERWHEGPGLFLLTDLFDNTSPVCAGADGEPIPLYLLPVDRCVREALYFWMARYKVIDRLWLDSSILEIEAYREMADPTSALAEQGRRLARTIESATKLPTFYYLHRYWGRRVGEEERLCPGCGHAWAVTSRNDERGLARFDFRCEPCRLVSQIAPTFENQRRARIGEWRGAEASPRRRRTTK